MTELTCKEVVELVTEYLTGAMPDAERARFDAHLSACDPCAEYLRQMRTTVALSGRLDEGALPDDVKRDLIDAFRRWRK
jgi:anti-sigma factor RsiW